MKVVSCFFALMLSISCVAKPVLFVGSEFPSVLEKTSSGEIIGIGADIIHLMEQRLGYDIEISFVPFKRALKMMENGSADGLIGPYKSVNREQYMHYTQQHIYEDQIYFYGKKESEIQWGGDFSLLKGQAVAVVLGWFLGAEFERHRNSFVISDVVNLEAGFKMLMADRVDLILAYPAAVDRVEKSLDIDNKIKLLPPAVTINKGYFAFSKIKANKEFVEQFDSQLSLMAKSGELHELVKKYPNLTISY